MASPGNRLIAGSELVIRPHGDNIGFDSRWGHQVGRGLQDASGNPVAEDSRNGGRAVPGEWLARGIVCALCVAAIALLLGAGCSWRDAQPSDIAACSGRCLAVGSEFDDLDLSYPVFGSPKVRRCWCKRSFDMPLTPIPVEYVSERERRCIQKCGDRNYAYVPASGDCVCSHGDTSGAQWRLKSDRGGADGGAR
jgi:hypothetical protein